MLPKIWQAERRAVGADLGLGRFQFDFDLEEDIIEVLKMEPFHFDYWMVSLVRWKPVFEANYPSKITFWVLVLDIPLQFLGCSDLPKCWRCYRKDSGWRWSHLGKSMGGAWWFQALGVSMEVKLDEGVEIKVSLRYEKLFGFFQRVLQFGTWSV